MAFTGPFQPKAFCDSMILFSVTGSVEQLGISATSELAVQSKKAHFGQHRWNPLLPWILGSSFLHPKHFTAVTLKALLSDPDTSPNTTSGTDVTMAPSL